MAYTELLKQRIDVMEGVSTGDADVLLKVFNVHTIGDFARLKYIRWAQPILLLAESEENLQTAELKEDEKWQTSFAHSHEVIKSLASNARQRNKSFKRNHRNTAGTLKGC